MLELLNIKKSFGSNTILNYINLSIDDGIISQYSTPLEILCTPKNSFVSEFILRKLTMIWK